MTLKSATKALEAAGFTLAKADANTQDGARMQGHRRDQCLEGTHSLGNVLICLHEFEKASQAIDAGTTVGLRQWPPGKKRISFVSGRRVVVIYSDQPDTGVADKAFEALKEIR
jgi:hypothetical protein